jgi:hypothetical protein
MRVQFSSLAFQFEPAAWLKNRQENHHDYNKKGRSVENRLIVITS